LLINYRLLFSAFQRVNPLTNDIDVTVATVEHDLGASDIVRIISGIQAILWIGSLADRRALTAPAC
jgi:hypothetical protein